MIYKYLFYSISFLVKKYDRFWNVGNTYFIGGAMLVGIMIAITTLNLLNILGIFFYNPLIWSNYYVLAYLPIMFGLSSVIYFGYKRRCDRVFDEILKMDLQKKIKYKIINVVHVVIVWGIYFMLGDIVREIYFHDGPSYAAFLVRILCLK